MSISTKSLYETDFAEWSDQMAKLLREGRFDQLDIENIAEEIEALGRSDKRQFRSRITEIIQHKLKLFLLTGGIREENERGWNLSILKQQAGIQSLFEESPSLRTLLTAEVLAKCYKEGARDFEASDFGCYARPPKQCPFTWDEILLADESRGRPAY